MRSSAWSQTAISSPSLAGVGLRRLPPWLGRVSAFAVGLLLLSGAGAGARTRALWETPGAYRVRIVGLGELPLDEEGTDTGQRVYGLHRLRIDPRLVAGPVSLHIQVDVLTGQVFGDTHAVGTSYVERRHGDPEREYDGWTRVEPRMLWVEWDLSIAVLRLGQMGSQWGLGLLADSGTEERAKQTRWVERFGDDWNGDLVDRVMISTTPLAPLTHGDLGDIELALGADFVYQDEHASFLDEDSAYQLIGSLLYPGEELVVGGYVVHRRQEDRDGERLETTAIDLYARWLLPLYELNADLRFQGEMVLQHGHTDRQRPAGHADGVDVRQLGWVGHAEIDWRCPRVATGVHFGYASGDADPDDGEARDFTFDPDHRVGFLLFPEVLRLITLRGADRLADPEQAATAPQGVEHLPTDGAVRNAFYVHPGITWRPGGWQFTVAALFAWAAEPFIDPREVFEAGGTATNHRGAPAQRYYGHELDASVHRKMVVRGLGSMTVGAEGGVFFSGSALDGPGVTDPLVKLVGRVDLHW